MNSPADKVTIEKKRCKGCELCVIFCPRKRISMSAGLNAYGVRYAVFTDETGEAACNSCGFCYLVCPEVAIEIRK
ncbi:MAG: hypothetical protein CVU77_07305 [Elusimicrobia bacterium HGW-Elusimicrobia-1]|nr:MAG: hypothetical protein CVU77_07305 [Elusimicrobia bacterium HGW-Elusimicrobia-1]